MSKKSHWRFISSTEPEKLVSKEEKTQYHNEKDKIKKELFKIGMIIDRMPWEKKAFPPKKS